MKKENNIFVCWSDTLIHLSRYVDSRTMKVIVETGFDKEDTIKILKVSRYSIKLAEEDHISNRNDYDTVLTNVGEWVTFSTYYAEVA